MSVQSDIEAIRSIIAGVNSNRVAKFSYTDTAFANDVVAGIENFDVDAEQNIPTIAKVELNDTIINKGIRTQGLSLPRMAVNHYYGRTSYNLNKLAQKFLDWVVLEAAAKANNAQAYDASAKYLVGAVCYTVVTKYGVSVLSKFIRTSVSPVELVGEPTTNTNHWAPLQCVEALDLLNTSIMPVGSIYIQLPGKSAPGSLFSGTWSNISASFPGWFFRAEGGDAAAFAGGVQAGQNKTHSHTTNGEAAEHTHGIGGATGAMSANSLHGHGVRTGPDATRANSSNLSTGFFNGQDGDTAGVLYTANTQNPTHLIVAANVDHYHTLPANTGGRSAVHTHGVNADGGTEVRPINCTVRIWERTA